MAKQKTPHDVKGWQMDCVNYQQCPLCYGCRAYDQSDLRCVNKCSGNRKQNICNRELHKADVLARMITKEKIVIGA